MCAPGNSWDLRSCRQQPRESLRDYIRRFSKQRTELPNITDSDVIGAFLAGTTCRDLVSKLGRKTPTRASELMDIATKFSSGQEAVEAIFRKDKQPQGRQPEDVPEASAQHSARKKGKKKSQAKRDATDADLVAAAEHRNPRKPPGGANLFDKMLKESCPYHQGPAKHTLEECVMLRRCFHRVGPPAEGGRAHNNDKKEDHKAEEFPEVHDCFMIYGGQVANASARYRKQERREVCSIKVAAPVCLDWSNKPITFNQGDHPDHVPSPGKYLLVVDPIIGNIRLTKVLMDGGSSLNIIYAETLRLLQIDPSSIQEPGPSRRLNRSLRSLSQLSPEDVSPAHGLSNPTPASVPPVDGPARLRPMKLLFEPTPPLSMLTPLPPAPAHRRAAEGSFN
jgi:hypothetical protein